MARRRGAAFLGALLAAGTLTLLGAAPAAAHVVPSTVIELDVHDQDVTATLTLPATDLRTASGIELPAAAGTSDTPAAVDASTAARVADYLTRHTQVGTPDGRAWRVTVDDVTTAPTRQWGTAEFAAVTARATWTPPRTTDLRSFTVHYDAIVHQVVPADTYVVLHSDWAAGEVESARALGTVRTDTVTGTVPALTVDLDAGSVWQGFLGMLGLGASHIAEGTDHQLFLLTLLLPAPLVAATGRWSGLAGPRGAVRSITAITLAFTVGHSVTLALGALGLPVPQAAVEAAIAVSILVAAAHAVRPLFPGHEPLVAGVFGLVHGMAFSTTLTDLDLSGGRLVLSLLGFNLGIELFQLVVVALVLPPWVVLARTAAGRPVRMVAALVTGVAALGWLLDRLGVPTVLSTAADSLAVVSVWAVAALWAAALGIAAPWIAARVDRRRADRGAVGQERSAVGADDAADAAAADGRSPT